MSGNYLGNKVTSMAEDYVELKDEVRKLRQELDAMWEHIRRLERIQQEESTKRIHDKLGSLQY